ncbi:MAG: metal-dependent hydrolase [Luteolibacter sp.]|uniref:metal-dependent hydrolase n=1 Tax=Luteolibacter sp. TaxID=1962973 RepID=UPI003266A0B5
MRRVVRILLPLTHPMDVFTHALAPVILTRLAFGRPAWLRSYGFLAIGIAGALPDLLNPHLSLAARLSSWSHGLPFWLLFTVLMFSLTLLKKLKLSWQLASILSFSYVFHMFCDSISGGVDWFYPFGHLQLGDYFVDPIYWVPLDVVLFLITYYLFRMLPTLEKTRRNFQSSKGA